MSEATMTARQMTAPANERRRRNRALIALLDSWMEEDPEEQRETFEFLRTALDEDRPRSRRLFAQP